MKKSKKNLIVTTLVVFLVLGFLGPIATFAAGPATVNLGSASDFVILTKSGISTTGNTSITGDIGVSPIAATAITGFGLIMDVSNTFSTSVRVTGKVYAANYTAPTPTKMTTAVGDMQNAYTDAAGRTNPTATELGAGNIGGMTLTPGLYKWSTGVTIPTSITLSGGANDVWIFQIAQNLTISSAMRVILSGGAQASNIFWQVAGQTTLGTTSVFNGNILDQTAIVLQTGATLNGRAFAQTAVTLDANTVIKPTAVSTPTPTPINGSCSSIHYSCNVGTNVSNVNGLTNWTWSCVGSNGGTTASCSETKPLIPTPISTPTPTPTLTPITTPMSPILTPTQALTPTTYTPNSLPQATPAPSSNLAPAPQFPNTGIAPDEKSISWGIVILAGIFMTSVLFSLIQRKQIAR